MDDKILITGGTGFIGSHTYVALADAGYRPIIIDNLCNSSPKVLERLSTITHTQPEFIEGDVRDKSLLNQIFSTHHISAVIHFAGLKAVGESVNIPLDYYDNNVHGTLSLLDAMHQANVKTLIFSSSATVYGNPISNPINEHFSLKATHPYGRSKLMVEDILADLWHAQSDWRIARLRYFNPVGAHESGLIGEEPLGIPNNLMPYIAQVAVGRRECLHVFGGDYPTPDGTGIRDYIHVMDLAEGHLAALNHLTTHSGGRLLTANLGTGHPMSVLQMIQSFEQASGKKIPYKMVERRPGDIAECWADPTFAQQTLGWAARRSIREICADTWRWQSLNRCPTSPTSAEAPQQHALSRQ